MLGYFGHMVELYTAWVLMPLILATRLLDATAVSWWAFAAVRAGAVGCVLGGLAARRAGSARVAASQSMTSVLPLTWSWAQSANTCEIVRRLLGRGSSGHRNCGSNLSRRGCPGLGDEGCGPSVDEVNHLLLSEIYFLDALHRGHRRIKFVRLSVDADSSRGGVNFNLELANAGEVRPGSVHTEFRGVLHHDAAVQAAGDGPHA